MQIVLSFLLLLLPLFLLFVDCRSAQPKSSPSPPPGSDGSKGRRPSVSQAAACSWVEVKYNFFLSLLTLRKIKNFL